MAHTDYADLSLPDRRPLGPLVAGAVTIALAIALTGGACYALAPGSRAKRAAETAAKTTASHTVKAAARGASSGGSHRAGRSKGSSANSEARVSGPRGRSVLAPGAASDTSQTTASQPAYVTRTVAMAPRVAIRGSGPLETVTHAGVPGMKKITVDSATGAIVESVVVRKPVSAQATRRHSSAGKVVALTFDDGPHPTQTPAILKILQAEQIKATFFMVGAMARYHPAAAKAVAAAGMLIGDHTEHHNLLPNVSEARVMSEIGDGAESIEKITGVVPHWFRSPYGGVSAAAERSAGQLGMRIATWDVDAEDWRNPKATAITNYVVSHVRPGSIVLLHDGGGSTRANTVAALPKIISALKKKGYRFVTLDQL